MPLEGDGSEGYLPETEQEEPRLSGKVSVPGANSLMKKTFHLASTPTFLGLAGMLPVVNLLSRAGLGVGCGVVEQGRCTGGTEEGKQPPHE